MKKLLKPALLAALIAVLVSLPFQASAQQGGGRGNFNREEMRQRMMDNYKQTLGVTNDDEWKVLEPRIQKVTEARREVGFGGGRAMFGMRRPGGQGGDNQGDGQTERRRGAFGGGQQSPAMQELEKAVESKASAETIKAKLTAYREERAQKQANLQKAQDELKKVLTVKQEAAAVLAGLLD